MRTALHAEWTKLRTLTGLLWLPAALAAVTFSIGALAVGVISCAPTGCDADPARIALTGVQVGQAFVVAFAVVVVGGEYASSMITTTLAAVPRRSTVLAAKAVVVTGPVLVAGAVAVAGSVLVGRVVLPGHGFDGALSPGDGAVWRAAGGSVLYLALVGVLALGATWILRDPPVALGAVLAVLYLGPMLVAASSDPHWHRRLEQIVPMTAGLAVQATRDLGGLPIGPWAGLGVLAAWAGGALLLGGLALRLRDA